MKRRNLLKGLALSPLALGAWGLPLDASGLVTSISSAHAADSTDALVELFGTLANDRPVERLFAAGPPASVLLYCMAPERLLGWPMTLAPEALALLPAAYRELPHLGRLAGRGSTVPLETLLRLAPQLILDTGTINDTYRSAARRTHTQTGIAYALADGKLAQAGEQLRAVGELIGATERAALLADYADDLLTTTHRPSVNDTSAPSVYLARGPDGLETPLSHTIHTEAIELAGARNIAAQAERGGLGRVSLEQLMAWDPDIIVTQYPEFYAAVRRQPIWQSLRAVGEGRLYLAPYLPFGWLDGPPGINRLLGLRWMRHLLADTANPKALHQEVAEFMALFYGQRPDSAVLKQLIPESATGHFPRSPS